MKQSVPPACHCCLIRSFALKAFVRIGLPVLLFIAGLVPFSAWASSTIFGGGPFYTGGYTVMNTLRASGYTTVMLWTIHVDASTGNLIYNDQLVVANGAYVGTPAWTNQLKTLKVAPTSVNRIEWSVASAPSGGNDFQNIQTLMNTYGTNTGSILYRNFLALKNATGADAIDYDDEALYDVATAVKFGQMLSSLGYKVTLCPYTNPSFWQSTYSQLGTGIVDRVYLQCYDGGAGNDPATWNNYFPGTKVIPGMWCLHNGCSQGSSATDVQAQMTAWRSSANIPGGFMWLYDDMLSCSVGGTPADYAAAINKSVDPLMVTPPAGFSGIAAYRTKVFPASTPLVLSNSGSTSLDWSLNNTSSWLTVSSTSGTLGGGASATVTASLVAFVATNLPVGTYTANLVFTNKSTGIIVARAFSLNTAVANWPVALTGFNAAILAGNTAIAGTSTATGFDVPNNYCFYQTGLSGGTRGLPLDGVFSSLLDSSTAFQLGSFGATDALMLGTPYATSGTLTLATPAAYNSLAILATSANGGGQGTCVLNFTDGSHSPAFAYNAQDWFYVVTNVALQGFGRLKLGASLSIEDNGSSNPNLYQTTLNLSGLGLTKPISSITFTKPGGTGSTQTTAILALSGLPASVPVATPTGLVALPGTNGTVQLTWLPSAGATNYNIKRSLASDGNYELAGRTSGTVFSVTGLANGTTSYFAVSAQGSGNETSNSVPVSATPGSYFAWTMQPQPLAYWPLNETNGTVAYDAVQGSNGVYGGGFVLLPGGVSGAGFPSPHRVVYYNGSTAYTQIPRLIGDGDFTIVFWMRTTATGGTANWYNGAGLVDGEVSGTTGDFGVALVGNKIGFGIGNPDTTLTSTATVNNGVWHQVAVSRNMSSGQMTICIDGKYDAGMVGPTGVRTNPPSLRLGSLQTANNFFNGYLSDVAMYGQVLGTNQIATLYSAATGLFYAVALTNQWTGSSLRLTWPGNGKLLEATNLSGPWTTNATPSPVTITPDQPQKFYRIQTQ